MVDLSYAGHDWAQCIYKTACTYYHMKVSFLTIISIEISYPIFSTKVRLLQVNFLLHTITTICYASRPVIHTIVAPGLKDATTI